MRCRGCGRKGLGTPPSWSVHIWLQERLAWPELTPLSFPKCAVLQPQPSHLQRASLLLPPQLPRPLVPDSELQNNLARQPEGNFYTPSQVSDLLAMPVCFHRCLFLHFIKRFFFLMKRTLWRKESEASHSSHFIFTKYFLCRRSDGLSLETHSSCLALFELSMPVDSHSGTWLARAGLFLSWEN